MALLVLKNRLQQPVFVRRFGRVSEVPVKVEKGEALPLDGVESFAMSLNGSSYSERTRSDSVSSLTWFAMSVLRRCGCWLPEQRRGWSGRRRGRRRWRWPRARPGEPTTSA